jgi:hypothetical protein
VKTFFSDAKFILILLALVTAISGVSNMEIEGDQHPTFQKSDLASGFLVLNDQHTPSRTVASVSSSGSSQVLTQSFFCNHSMDAKTVTAAVESELIMLDFKVCRDLKNIESLTLTNQTNGFKAHIFKTDNFSYKTDFIQLDKGSNKITVEVVLKDGQKKQDSLVIITGS